VKLIEEAEELMLYQFKDAPKLKGLLRSLVQPLQSVADGVEHFSQGIHFDEVHGYWLDVFGGIVGQSRLGMSDADMRVWIKIRIILNRGNGTSEEVISIIRLLCGPDYPLTITEYHANEVVFTFFAPLITPPETVFSLIKQASSPGFKHHFVNAAISNPFQLDTTSFLSSQFADFF
jgi:hypothetical protein